jgi:hypothetical protein
MDHSSDYLLQRDCRDGMYTYCEKVSKKRVNETPLLYGRPWRVTPWGSRIDNTWTKKRIVLVTVVTFPDAYNKNWSLPVLSTCLQDLRRRQEPHTTVTFFSLFCETTYGWFVLPLFGSTWTMKETYCPMLLHWFYLWLASNFVLSLSSPKWRTSHLMMLRERESHHNLQKNVEWFNACALSPEKFESK